MGHEAAGIGHKVGSGVRNVKVGDRIAIEPGIPCRTCKRCKAGKYNLCAKIRFDAAPPYTDGTLCRFFKAPEDFVFKIPDSFSQEEAVLVQPFSVAVHGARLADLKAGQTILVQGSGTIGLLAAAVPKAFGPHSVYIADINEKKLEFARSFVDCKTFLSDTSATPFDEARRFKAVMGLEDGADVVLECSGVESSAQTGIYASGAGAVFV